MHHVGQNFLLKKANNTNNIKTLTINRNLLFNKKLEEAKNKKEKLHYYITKREEENKTCVIKIKNLEKKYERCIFNQ